MASFLNSNQFVQLEELIMSLSKQIEEFINNVETKQDFKENQKLIEQQLNMIKNLLNKIGTENKKFISEATLESLTRKLSSTVLEEMLSFDSSNDDSRDYMCNILKEFLNNYDNNITIELKYLLKTRHVESENYFVQSLSLILLSILIVIPAVFLFAILISSLIN
jgi:hypothetical protein